MEELAEYRADKLLCLFEAGVFEERVSRMGNTRRVANEVVFDGLIERHKIAAEDVWKNYRCLCKLCDFTNGLLVVKPKQVGNHFYAFREEKGARQKRSAFFKYIIFSNMKAMTFYQSFHLPHVCPKIVWASKHFLLS